MLHLFLDTTFDKVHIDIPKIDFIKKADNNNFTD